ncbi:MAG: GTPase ObgE, partial [Chloroflexota bacterium]|nr:GTPase ObgE [Chloroflexota bacterium]
MLDTVKIYVCSGDGGDGIIGFRREKYVPQGGPSGGDGGHGGDVILRAVKGLNTLAPFSKKVHFKAERGDNGGQSNRTGASADDMIVEVPLGTVVRFAESGAAIADLVRPGDSVVVASGGRGGKGNARFATSNNQAPRIAEKGEPGMEYWLTLELRLIADVGIVGVPNAGKSTLLSVISNARPKIADYPFTTLEPNLGVVILDNRDLVVADIPGLVEGAHRGVGLGHAFLRHVKRTRLLIHLIDGSADDPLADFNQINQELALYDERLGERPQIVAFNKMDLPHVAARFPDFQAALRRENREVLPLSGATHKGIEALVNAMFAEYDTLPLQLESVPTMPIYDLPEEQLAFEIEKLGENVYRVGGKRIERAAAMTYWDYEEAILRFQRMLDTIGVTAALRKA